MTDASTAEWAEKVYKPMHIYIIFNLELWDPMRLHGAANKDDVTPQLGTPTSNGNPMCHYASLPH